MELYLILLVAGFVSGILTILFGFAGGFVVVPLVYSTIRMQYPIHSTAYDLAFKSAVASSLLLMVINSGLATYQQYKLRKIHKQYLFPIAYWIAAGAILGTLLALNISSHVLKWSFALYLCFTIFDCLIRQFKQPHSNPQAIRLLTKTEQGLGGIFIGGIASALGVGGSVMTVPLFRRCGLDMSSAVALANPLSMPVAIAGCITLIIGQIIQPQHLGTHFVGYFYYPALIALIIGGFLGMKLAIQWTGKLSNQTHEQGYILLLTLVLISILFQ
ncbi:sulfite exporter TauE/SafE family protein [Acinetobacter guillouiae]|uniref:sulfite exporter TauE/SafE family protein n=1 Tax=Acinetobacter guillouiae TaxID=106649 RepID=UPI003AF654CB